MRAPMCVYFLRRVPAPTKSINDNRCQQLCSQDKRIKCWRWSLRWVGKHWTCIRQANTLGASVGTVKRAHATGISRVSAHSRAPLTQIHSEANEKNLAALISLDARARAYCGVLSILRGLFFRAIHLHTNAGTCVLFIFLGYCSVCDALI